MDDTSMNQVKTIFDAWETLGNEKKDLTKEMRDYITQAAKLMEIKNKKVTAMFNGIKKLNESGINEAEEVSELIEKFKDS